MHIHWSHVSVCVPADEHDDRLALPICGDIDINVGFFKETIHFHDHMQIYSRHQVSMEDKASSGCGNAYLICNHE